MCPNDKKVTSRLPICSVFVLLTAIPIIIAVSALWDKLLAVSGITLSTACKWQRRNSEN